MDDLKARFRFPEVHISHDYDGGPDVALVELGVKGIDHILHLMKIVEREDVYTINKFSYAIRWYSSEDSDDYTMPLADWEGSTECHILHIQKDCLYWTTLLKHTDIEFEARTLYKKDLIKIKEALKVSPLNGLVEFVDTWYPSNSADIDDIVRVLTCPTKELSLYLNLETGSVKSIVELRLKGGF